MTWRWKRQFVRNRRPSRGCYSTLKTQFAWNRCSTISTPMHWLRSCMSKHYVSRRSSSPFTVHPPTIIYIKPFTSITSLSPLNYTLEPSLEPSPEPSLEPSPEPSLEPSLELSLEPSPSSTPRCLSPSVPVFCSRHLHDFPASILYLISCRYAVVVSAKY